MKFTEDMSEQESQEHEKQFRMKLESFALSTKLTSSNFFVINVNAL